MKFRRVQANKGMQPKRAKGQHWATRQGSQPRIWICQHTFLKCPLLLIPCISQGKWPETVLLGGLLCLFWGSNFGQHNCCSDVEALQFGTCTSHLQVLNVVFSRSLEERVSSNLDPSPLTTACYLSRTTTSGNAFLSDTLSFWWKQKIQSVWCGVPGRKQLVALGLQLDSGGKFIRWEDCSKPLRCYLSRTTTSGNAFLSDTLSFWWKQKIQSVWCGVPGRNGCWSGSIGCIGPSFWLWWQIYQMEGCSKPLRFYASSTTTSGNAFLSDTLSFWYIETTKKKRLMWSPWQKWLLVGVTK